MWNRADLKERAKSVIGRNYWRCVLAALILAVFVQSGNNNGNSNDSRNSGNVRYEIRGEEAADLYQNRKFPVFYWVSGFLRRQLSVTIMYLLLIGAFILRIFVFSMLEIGGCRFFIENAYRPAAMGEFLFAFRSGGYGKMVLTQLLRDLYTFLWSLLLIIPGIVKSYEYCMIPYLLADFPELTTDGAFSISREMMDGNKWDTFVLDLSFFGWELLSAVTLGIAGIFYVNPYEYATKAELYLKLKTRYFGQAGAYDGR